MAWDKPLPHVTALARPFWQGTRERELRLQRCRVCGSYRFPPQVLCRVCLAEEHDWTATSGKATVYSFVVHHRPPTPRFPACERRADDVTRTKGPSFSSSRAR